MSDITTHALFNTLVEKFGSALAIHTASTVAVATEIRDLDTEHAIEDHMIAAEAVKKLARDVH